MLIVMGITLREQMAVASVSRESDQLDLTQQSKSNRRSQPP